MRTVLRVLVVKALWAALFTTIFRAARHELAWDMLFLWIYGALLVAELLEAAITTAVRRKKKTPA